MRVLIIVGLGACYRPAPPAGAPCAADQSCPAPLECHAPTQTCEPPGFLSPDADPPDADPTCWPRWRDGSVRLSAPVPLLKEPGRAQHDPSLSGDELTLYFVRDEGTSNLWRATRTSRADEFANPETLSLSSTAIELRLTASPALADVIYSTNRNGGTGGIDFWRTTPVGGAFGPPDQVGLAAVNSALSDFDPELTADGLGLYFAAGATSELSLVVARRPSLGAEFGGPTQIDFVSNLEPAPELDPTLSPDESVLVYSRGPAASSRQIYYAVAGQDGFEDRGLVRGIEALTAFDPELTSDGCQLYFATGGDLVVSTVLD